MVTRGIRKSSKKLKQLCELANLTKTNDHMMYFKKYMHVYRKTIRAAKKLDNVNYTILKRINPKPLRQL